MNHNTRLNVVMALFLVAMLVTSAFAVEQCISIRTTDNDNEASAIFEVKPFNAPWAVWAHKSRGTAQTVVVRGYGPCLDKATPCDHGVARNLGTFNGSDDFVVGGPGPIEAIDTYTSTVCTTRVCDGGPSHDLVCTTDSECPSSFCLKCSTTVNFCGIDNAPH